MSEVDPSPTYAQVIRSAIARGLAELRVAMPGRIETYDATTQKASVLPLLKDAVRNADGGIDIDPFPVIPGVPVLFSGGGGFRTTYPVRRGDTCLIIFSDKSMDLWKSAGGGPIDPVNTRAHELADAVCIVGLHSFADAWNNSSTSAQTVGYDGGPHATFTDSGINLGGVGDEVLVEPVPLGQQLVAYLQQLVVWMTAHTHVGIIPSTPPVTLPVPPVIPAQLLSALVKVK